jgi:hypothetical protein
MIFSRSEARSEADIVNKWVFKLFSADISFQKIDESW